VVEARVVAREPPEAPGPGYRTPEWVKNPIELTDTVEPASQVDTAPRKRSRVTLRTLGAVAALMFLLGYFTGRAHVRYELRRAAQDVFTGLGQGFTQLFDAKATKTTPRTVKAEMGRDEQAYMATGLQLYDVRARYYNDIVDGKVAATFGKIKNVGDKALAKVVVTAYFLDKADAVIFENSYPAVLVGSGIVGNGGPLKPNYIREFGFKTKDCPSEWAEGKVKVGITAIEFEEPH